MEIQLSSMRRGSYQAMITVMNMVSMTRISTCIRVQVSSDGLTMCILLDVLSLCCCKRFDLFFTFLF